MTEVRRRRRRKNNGCLYFVLTFLVVLIGGGYFIFHTDYIQRKFVYPWPYTKEIHQYSAKYRVDPFLVVAVIKNESGFKPEAQSKPGALGLMQIMPETGAWIARTTDFPNFQAKLLKLPELNIKFGSWYLSELEHEFRGNEVLMLAAYNAGRGTVKGWMEERGWGYDFQDISSIPFADTRKYVDKVIKDRNRYQALYKNDKPLS